MTVSLYGIFLGIHIGDGSIPKFKKPRYLWEVRQRTLTEAKKVQQIVYKLFRIKPRIRKWRNLYSVEVLSKQFWWILTQEIGFPEGKKTLKITIPTYLSPSIKLGILNGLIGTDGTIFRDSNGAPRIRIKLRSKNLIYEIHRLLEEMRIKHTLNESIEKTKVPFSTRTYMRRFWRIDIYGRNVIKLKEGLGKIWNPLKEERLKNIISEWSRATANRCPS
jgi:hypothetical protein